MKRKGESALDFMLKVSRRGSAMSGQRLTLARDVLQSECSWLARDMKAGEVVYRYDGVTYGCIASGVACTERDGETPFFELPRDAVSSQDQTK